MKPGVVTSGTGQKATVLDLNRHSIESAVYAEHEYSAGSRLKVNYGLRISSFHQLGPGDYYTFNEDYRITDTISYAPKEVIKHDWQPEPRLSLHYSINDQSSLKAAYVRTTQNLHLLSNASVTMPSDLWIPNSLYIKPELSDQISVGYYRSMGNNNRYELSVETYYKNMQNQIDYRDGAEIEFNPTVETELLLGKGRAYGLEMFWKKNHGRLTGWLSYTLSRTQRKFDEINEGEYYPARQDRTHDVSLVGMYKLSNKWTLSFNWIYYTGNAVTFPGSKYPVGDMVVAYYSERNAYRMPSYHRLDLGATWHRKKTKRFESSWNFSLYNAYAQENPVFINFRQSTANPERMEMVQTSLFRLIPSVTYNFRFL